VAGEQTRTFVAGEIKEAIDNASWRWKALDIAIKISMPVLLSMAGWGFMEIQDLDKRVGVIEATRYTRRDAENDRRETQQILQEIKVILAGREPVLKDLQESMKKVEARLDSGR